MQKAKNGLPPTILLLLLAYKMATMSRNGAIQQRSISLAQKFLYSPHAE